MLSLAALCFGVLSATAQQFNIPEKAISDPAALSKAMPTLAEEVIAAYKDDDRDKFLDNWFRMQMVAGHYEQALLSISELRALWRQRDPGRAAWVNVQYEIYAAAKIKAQSEDLPFSDAFGQVFRDTFARLDDPPAALVIRALAADEAALQRNLQNDLDQQKGKATVSLANALNLLRDYQVAEDYQEFSRLAAPLVAEDDARRYIIQKDLRVKVPDGATVCALIVRPRNGPAKLPTLLEFTIYADPERNLDFSARLAASHAYAGVVGLVRGKACSPDQPEPYVHDASDGAALVNWISTQPWSDGRVGMYGGSYSGGAAWAVAKRMPKALKTIDVGAPVAPGIDVPAEGNVFWNFLYPWPFYTTDVRGLDNRVYNDTARWQRLNREWYVSGRAYRNLEKIDGTPNPIFDQWISHPSYDEYWQNMIPYQEEFARINIPVLQTAGYYFGGPGAAVYYLTEQYRYHPKAEHYLVIGPYDHVGAQRGTVGVLGQESGELAGYKLDEAALINLEELRYQWFDYVLKGGPKPALLKDTINYEVTGANVWKHASTLSAMHGATVRFHLDSQRSGNSYLLTEQGHPVSGSIPLAVNFSDRSDADRNPPGGGVRAKAVDTWNGVEFVSQPLPPLEMSGLFSGHLEFVVNKKDFDFEIDLYELTPGGDYVQLAQYWSRASYVSNRSHRHLLALGKRARLDFQSSRLMSRQFVPGSRLVAVLSVIKQPGRQINYGTGTDVSEETIQAAGTPLEITWFTDSYIDIPVAMKSPVQQR